MSRTRARTAAVVGAGAAGLVAARELLREGHAVTVFERSGRVGGTWAYDARSDPDPLGLDPAAPGAVHGSLYASLRTNLPRELMGFSGFALQGRVFAGDPRTFPGHREVLAFLDAFAEESGVAGHVRLRAEVRRLRPLGPGEGWSVEWRGDAGDAEEVFDAVVVCNGHCTVPLVPKLRGIENWRGNHMHSHNYRTPEPFQDQVVVVVGLGASGVDIAREISKVAKEVHIASRYTQDRVGKVDIYQNVWLRSEVQSSQLSYLLLDSISLAFHGVTRKQQHVTVLMQLIACEYKQVDCIQDDGKVCFMEGSAVTADTILYCTGWFP
ncbi:hypothetical protein GUJ93_ZPchr0012g22032 [Zizania palustris]|uniref:Flavin-containing monooxygenase n=1 Tax=Zizania palustris TaxID=103762 RepID=A0A8J6BT15_ZIZPA|nr:hypothetical protein GUJ93_ZPchr0012g22032 [Zizania palustris]